MDIENIIKIQNAYKKHLRSIGFYKTIKCVHNPIYVGEIILKDNTNHNFNMIQKGSWRVEYKLEKDKATCNKGRVYIITSDGIIKKIGKSESRGGIKNTFGSYQNGLGGSPSIRTFGIHMLIAKELLQGNKVEIYMIESPFIECQIQTLFGQQVVKVSPSVIVFEELCKNEYKEKNKEYPEWNFQEKKCEWPKDIYNNYLVLMNKRNTNNDVEKITNDLRKLSTTEPEDI